MRERKIALRAHMMHLFHGALHWMRNIVLKAVPITTGVTTQKTDSPPWTPYCFKLQWQLSPGALTYTPQRIWKDNFLPQTALIHWLQGGTFWVSYETHPSFFFFYLPFFFFSAGWPSNMCFCSLFCAHQPPPRFWFSHFQPVQKHCNAFPWKQFWGGSCPPSPACSPLSDGTGRLYLPVCIPQGCPRLEPFPVCKSLLAVRSWHQEGTTPPAPQTCCPSPGRERRAGFPTLWHPRDEVCSLQAHDSRCLCQQTDHARRLWWMRTRHLFCDSLHPHTPCCAEDQRWQTIVLPAYFLMILHFHISSNTGYLQQAVRRIPLQKLKRQSLNYFLVQNGHFSTVLTLAALVTTVQSSLAQSPSSKVSFVRLNIITFLLFHMPCDGSDICMSLAGKKWSPQKTCRSSDAAPGGWAGHLQVSNMALDTHVWARRIHLL